MLTTCDRVNPLSDEREVRKDRGTHARRRGGKSLRLVGVR